MSVSVRIGFLYTKKDNTVTINPVSVVEIIKMSTVLFLTELRLALVLTSAKWKRIIIFKGRFSLAKNGYTI